MASENDPANAQLLSPATVGDVNRSRVLQALWDHGPQSRADLARLVGVTRGTIGNIVQALLDAGLIEEGEPRTGQVGKPAVPLWFTTRAALTCVATIGATGVDAALVNAPGDVLAHTRAAFNDGDDVDREQVESAVISSLRRVAGDEEGALTGVGIAVPGVYDPGERFVVGSGPLPALVGGWLPTAVEGAFGVPVLLENDSRVLALGERWFGEGRGRRTFAALQTGDGLGVGMVVNGQLLRGGQPHAAEFGHVCVDVEGTRCVCGLRGCWETIASLRWLRGQARMRKVRGARSLTSERLVALADDDHDAAELLDNYAEHLAVGIANLQQVFAPEVVILHGDVEGGGEPLRARIEEHTRKRVFAGDVDLVDVRLSDLGTNAGLVGAAALVFSEHFALTA